MQKNLTTKFTLRKSSLYGLIIALTLCIAAIGSVLYVIIPESISVFAGEETDASISIPFIKVDSLDTSVFEHDEEYRGGMVASYQTEAKLFGTIPVKNIDVNVYKDLKVYPGGMPFGVKLYTQGVMVVGLADITSGGANVNPAKDAGIKPKDIITAVNGKEIESVTELTDLIENCGGNSLNVTFIRNQTTQNVTLKPIISDEDGLYHAGIWIRDNTAGIGTVTFIIPETGAFGGLGHGICDIDTGELIPMKRGMVTGVTISGINKGLAGTPGELKGYFNADKLGTLLGNTSSGVFGVMAKLPEGTNGETVPIGLRDSVKEGKAVIRCSLDESGIKEYPIEISKTDRSGSVTKNMVISVTDPSLIEKTGGIVQGMSGSPIFQDGKLIGAVTHVMVNDPTQGYGIYIENMLQSMPELSK